MIVSATVRCQHCGAVISIPPKKTTRSFNIAFKKLVRQHDWRCEQDVKERVFIQGVNNAVADIMKKITTE